MVSACAVEPGEAGYRLLRLHSGAYVCAGCLESHARVQMDEGRVPLACPCGPVCPRRLELSSDYFITQALLPPEGRERLLGLELRALGFRILRCPSCAAPFDAGSGAAGGFAGVSRTVQCPHVPCTAVLCLECGQAAHGGRGCNEVHTPDLTQQEREALGIKQCPNCSADIQKSEGCVYMRCGANYHQEGSNGRAGCGTYFCWRCLGTRGMSGSYSHRGGCSG